MLLLYELGGKITNITCFFLETEQHLRRCDALVRGLIVWRFLLKTVKRQSAQARQDERKCFQSRRERHGIQLSFSSDPRSCAIGSVSVRVSVPRQTQ